MDTFVSPLPAVFSLMSCSQAVYFHNFNFFLSFWLVFFHVVFCSSSLLLFLILLINFCEYTKHNLLDIFLFQILIPIRLAKLSCDSAGFVTLFKFESGSAGV